MSNQCRGCGKSDVELKTSISETILGQTKYKDVYETVMGRPMNTSQELSRKICEVCRTQMELVAALGMTWKGNERALQLSETFGVPLSSPDKAGPSHASPSFFTSNNDSGPSTSKEKSPPKKRKRGRLPRVKSESDLVRNSFFHYERIPNFYEKKKTFSKSFNNFQNVKDLFAEKLAFKDPLTDLGEFQHIRIDRKDFNDQGEISAEWLNMYQESKKWSDFAYMCPHCNIKFIGLMTFMDHMKSVELPGFRATCPEPSCPREYSNLYSYINHTAEHHGHLNFCCIFCEPSKIFINSVCLINHYMEMHKDVNFALYFCLECAHYCQNISQLRVHVMSQHEPIQKINSNSSDESDDDTPKRRRQDADWKPPAFTGILKKAKSHMNLPPNQNSDKKQKEKLTETHPGKRFHPKVHDVGNRVTYPCTVIGCDRVLLTLPGLQYHLLTHSGEKPYNCRTCGKAFRSKSLLSTHEAAKKCAIPIPPPGAEATE